MYRLLMIVVLALLMVGPVAAQATPEPAAPVVPVVTTPYDAAIIALIGVLIAVLGIGGYVLVKNSSTRMIAEVVVSVLEVAVKLTPSTTDDAEVAKLRAELEKLKADADERAKEIAKQIAWAAGHTFDPTTVTGADVIRDEVEAEG